MLAVIWYQSNSPAAIAGGGAAPAVTTPAEADSTGAAAPRVPVTDSTRADEPPVAVPVESVPASAARDGVSAGPVTSGDQAAGLVMALPDVKAWAAAVAEARAQGKKRRALLTVERTPQGDYSVHVFESVEDDEPGHTATLGWFKVDHRTGGVRNETVDSE